MPDFSYEPDGEVLRQFLKDDASFVKVIRGPFGSGKSVGCCVLAALAAKAQKPDRRTGIRKTRGLVVRNTSPMLKSTTIKTWLERFPEDQYGPMKWQPPITHHIRQGDVDMEVLFVGLDRPAEVKKVFSMDLSWAWLNEIREIDKEIVDGVTARVDRYPSDDKRGVYCNVGQVFMDTNSPDAEHWLPIMAGDVDPPEWMTEDERLRLVKPDNWTFYTQPPAMLEVMEGDRVIGYEINPKAENLANLKSTYYPNLITGKRTGWINVFVLNRYGSLVEGHPVFVDSFNREFHVLSENKLPTPHATLILGLDFGLTPAGVLIDPLGPGIYRVLAELVLTNCGSSRLARTLKQWLPMVLNGQRHPVIIWGDKHGDERDSNENTVFDVMRANEVRGSPVWTDDPGILHEAGRRVMESYHDGQPALQINPRCITLIKGLESKYMFKKKTGATFGEVYDLKVSKNRWSHVVEAFLHGLVGAGEGASAIIPAAPPVPSRIRRAEGSIFDRAGRRSIRNATPRDGTRRRFQL